MWLLVVITGPLNSRFARTAGSKRKISSKVHDARSMLSLLAFFQSIVDLNPGDDKIMPKPLKKTSIHEVIKGPIRIFCFRHGSAWVLHSRRSEEERQNAAAEHRAREQIMSEDLVRFEA